MIKFANKVIGRYEDNSGGALTIAVTRVFGGRDPFEIILFDSPDKTKNPVTIHRAVLDTVGHTNTKSQGQVTGIHGYNNFTEERIKNVELVVHPLEFCSARGQVHMSLDVIVTEFRFPANLAELQSDPTDDSKLLYKSLFSFRGLEGSLLCSLKVFDNTGVILVERGLQQVDRTVRKYSVTTNKGTRLPNQRKVVLTETDIKLAAPVSDSSPQNPEMMTDSQDYVFLGVSSQIDSKDD